MKAAAIFLTKLKPSRTLIATAWRTLVEAATGLMAIVRMAETVAGAAGVLAAVDAIVDAAGAADGLVVAVGIAGAAGLVGVDTRNCLPRIFSDNRTNGRPR